MTHCFRMTCYQLEQNYSIFVVLKTINVNDELFCKSLPMHFQKKINLRADKFVGVEDWSLLAFNEKTYVLFT